MCLDFISEIELPKMRHQFPHSGSGSSVVGAQLSDPSSNYNYASLSWSEGLHLYLYLYLRPHLHLRPDAFLGLCISFTLAEPTRIRTFPSILLSVRS